jgi:hypothetical protein
MKSPVHESDKFGKSKTIRDAVGKTDSVRPPAMSADSGTSGFSLLPRAARQRTIQATP